MEFDGEFSPRYNVTIPMEQAGLIDAVNIPDVEVSTEEVEKPLESCRAAGSTFTPA
jgi:hypothetical protein